MCMHTRQQTLIKSTIRSQEYTTTTRTHEDSEWEIVPTICLLTFTFCICTFAAWYFSAWFYMLIQNKQNIMYIRDNEPYSILATTMFEEYHLSAVYDVAPIERTF